VLVNTRLLTLCLALLAGAPAAAFPQSTYGAVVGVANDSSGAGRPDTNLTSANYGRITSLSPIFPLRTVVIGGRITY
jgi:hypothetical protein